MALFEQIEIPYRADTDTYPDRLRVLGRPVWLDSGKPGSVAGRWDIFSAAPLFGLDVGADGVLHWWPGEQSPPDSLRRAESFSTAVNAALVWLDGEASALPFRAGLLGYWSYDLGLNLQRVSRTLPDRVRLPQASLGCYSWALLQDHQAERALLVFHRATPPALRARVCALVDATDAEVPTDSPFALRQPFSPTLSEAGYLAAMARIHDYIRAGDCYQVNFTQHWAAPFAGAPWQAYRRLRNTLASPFSAWLDDGQRQFLCFSPERFIEIRGREVETRPIKGTLRRGDTPGEDRQNAATLLASEKDRAENLMIVDLLRNDLGRCCEPGSIRADRLFELETYPNVHHLVSTITGTLRPEVTAIDMLLAAFPGGSITGAPKRRAMEIIEETESLHRGLYCGCIGYIDVGGHMDTNIVIRSLVAQDGELHCWGGGGIVADSDPHQEYRESVDKIAVLLQQLEQMKG